MGVPPTTDRLQNTMDLAEFFQVSRKTIRTWHRDGWLRAIRVGRELRFRKADVDAFVESGLNRPSDTAQGGGQGGPVK